MRGILRFGGGLLGGLVLALGLAGCSESASETPTSTKPAAATTSLTNAAPTGTPATAGELALPEMDLTKLAPGQQTKLGDARYRARRAPGDVAVVGALGAMCYVHGFPDAAVVCFQRANQLAPADPAWLYDLARACEKTGDKAQATSTYEKLLKIKDYPQVRARLAALRGQPAPPTPTSQPEDDLLETALLRLGLDVQATVNAALQAASRGEFKVAREILEDARAMDETGVRTHTGMGLLYNMHGDFDKAIGEFDQALALPGGQAYTPAKAALAGVLVHLKRYDRAVPVLRELIHDDPNQLDAVNTLAWVYATNPNPDLRASPEEAVRLAERANTLTKGAQHFILDTLAAAYANAGRFDDAKKTIAEAIRLAEASNRPDAVSTYRARQSLYEMGKPFRDTP